MFLNKLKCVYESLINIGHEIMLLGNLNIDMLQQGNELQFKKKKEHVPLKERTFKEDQTPYAFQPKKEMYKWNML